MESVASQATPKGRSVSVNPDNPSGNQNRWSYWVDTFNAWPRSSSWIIAARSADSGGSNVTVLIAGGGAASTR
jgi:hypothetical protein